MRRNLLVFIMYDGNLFLIWITFDQLANIP